MLHRNAVGYAVQITSNTCCCMGEGENEDEGEDVEEGMNEVESEGEKSERTC